MARRHYTIKGDKPIPQGWGEWEFEIDLTAAGSVANVLVAAFDDDGLGGNLGGKAGVIVDWGDGNIEQIMGGASTNAWSIRHTFPSKQKYTIKMQEVYHNGITQERIIRIYFNTQSYNCLSKINKFKSDGITSLNYLAHGRVLFEGFADGFQFETPNVTIASSMFYGCTKLITFPLNVFNKLTKATTFYYTFDACSNLTSVADEIFKYNTKVTSYNDTFAYCPKLASNINDIFRGANLSNVITVGNMCRNCTQLKGSGLDLIAAFNKPPTTTSTALNGCTSLSDYASIPATWK